MTRIDITLPKDWTELSQVQLRFLLSAIDCVNRRNEKRAFSSQEDYAAFTSGQVQTLCFFRWSGLSVVCPYADGWLVKSGEQEFFLDLDTVVWAASRLSWTAGLPEFPVRLDTVDGAEAIPADISSGLSFDSWLACETSWQCYQANPDDSFLTQMAAILYGKEEIKPDATELLGVFYWWAGVKALMSRMFPDFFKRVEGGGESAPPSYDDMRRSMDTQIRALTKGDVTKERDVLALDAIRALTELDALAREYEELNRKYPSS